MSCKPAYFNGWGSCKSLLEKMNGAALQDKGVTMSDANATLLTYWRTAIADDDSAVRNTLILPILSFENTTDDVEIITSPLGKKIKGSDPIPSGVIYLDASILDYKTLHALQGQEYELFPSFEGGQYWAARKADGTLKGFRCTIATKAGLPPDDKLQSFPLYVFFTNYSEFENVVVVSDMDWTMNGDLLDYVPVGLDIQITTAYSAGDVTVLVTKRGSGDALTGLVAADFEVMKASRNATPPVGVTAVTENGAGSYTLTIEQDTGGTPANLAATDYCYLQAHADDGTYLTYLSHSIKIVGG